MADQSEELKKLELISTARKIVNAEYIKRRSDEYNLWLLANKDAIKNQNIALPFPPLGGAYIPFQSSVKFPTEEDVVKKAVELYRLTTVHTTMAAEPTPASTSTEPQPIAIKPQEPETTIEPPAETLSDPVPEDVTETTFVSDELTDIQLRDALVAEIYKIYEDVAKPETITEPKLSDHTVTTPEIYNMVQTIPEKITETISESTIAPLPEMGSQKSGIMPSVLQKIQEMKDRWSNKGEQNV
jgi:hypothetical protein